ncbi:MAG: hypothetical protein ABIG11_11130, partial [bacterium]
ATGHAHFMFRKGKHYGVTTYNLLRMPDGEKLFLVGNIGHTHPFGPPKPSSGDVENLQNDRETDFGKPKWRILSVAGASSLYEYTGRVIHSSSIPAKELNKSVFGLFEGIHLHKK